MSVSTYTKPWRNCTKAQLLEAVEMLIEQRDKAIDRAAEAGARFERVQAIARKARQTPAANDPYHVAMDIADDLESAMEVPW